MGRPHSQDVVHVEESIALEANVKQPGDLNEASRSKGPVVHQLTPEQAPRDKKVPRKIDLLILPLCTLNYFFSSMDRGDVGNARIAGFQTLKFSTVVSLFYSGYILFQPVDGLSIRWFEPYLVLGLANMVWGAATILMMTFKDMVAPSILRVVIGAAEGITEINGVYLTFWYTPQEYAVRAGIWYSFGVLATNFNGLIAYGI